MTDGRRSSPDLTQRFVSSFLEQEEVTQTSRIVLEIIFFFFSSSQPTTTTPCKQLWLNKSFFIFYKKVNNSLYTWDSNSLSFDLTTFPWIWWKWRVSLEVFNHRHRIHMIRNLLQVSKVISSWILWSSCKKLESVEF